VCICGCGGVDGCMGGGGGGVCAYMCVCVCVCVQRYLALKFCKTL
jgi:hypothetical protein